MKSMKKGFKALVALLTVMAMLVFPTTHVHASDDIAYKISVEAVSKDEIDIILNQKYYIMKLNLLGNNELIKVSRKEASAYNGYLEIAYQYGIFILLPLFVFQLCTLKRRKGVWNYFGFLLSLSFVLLSLGRSTGNMLTHPWWLWCYVLPGFWFEKNSEENEEYFEISLR